MEESSKRIQLDFFEFRKMVQRYLGMMKVGAPLAIDDYVTMVRIWNTIEFLRLESLDPDLEDYAKLFFSGYLEMIAKQLNAKVSKGMSFYSPKYDLYIGGKPHANSEFELSNTPKSRLK